MKTSYILTHLAEDREKYFNAVSPPIIQTSNFTFASMADFRKSVEDERAHHIYTRGNNPTVNILCKKIAALQGTEDALAVSCGAAAISNAIASFVKSGDHVICVDNCYHWAEEVLYNFLKKFGVTVTMVDGRDIENFKKALQPNTTLIFVESPTSLMFDLQDLEAVTQFAKENNLITVLDHTYASPMDQTPAKYGIDLIIHTATKHIGGHSDTLGGFICGKKEHLNHIFNQTYMTFGNVLSPNDAWLLLRGLRTMPLRLHRSSSTTQQVISFLENHPATEQIFYPTHPSHPQYDLAKKQMRFKGQLFSIKFKNSNIKKLEALVDKLEHFLIAVSWGGHESLALALEVPYHGKTLPIVRFYIGLEEADYLIDDLKQGLEILEA